MIAKAPSTTATVTIENALSTAEGLLGGKFDNATYPAPSLEYLAKENGSLALTHVFHVINETAGTYYEAFVDAHSGELVSVTDFVAHATVSVEYNSSLSYHSDRTHSIACCQSRRKHCWRVLRI